MNEGDAVKEIDTESNSTIEPDQEVSKMTDNQLTAKLFQHLLARKPVGVMSRLPTLDEVRAIITADFSCVDELWKIRALKTAVSR